MTFLKQTWSRRLKVTILTVSVWVFAIYLIKATTTRCNMWDGDCQFGHLITSIALTILIVFIWQRISKKFTL